MKDKKSDIQLEQQFEFRNIFPGEADQAAVLPQISVFFIEYPKLCDKI